MVIAVDESGVFTIIIIVLVVYVECIVFACVKMTAEWTEDAME